MNEIQASLPAGGWEVIIALLRKAPYEVSAPIVERLMPQLQMASAKAAEKAPDLAP